MSEPENDLSGEPDPAAFSRITLGTLQFGMNYGFASQSEQPSYRTCVEILVAAREEGINCFDKAANYGDRGRVLGPALTELNAKENSVPDQ